MGGWSCSQSMRTKMPSRCTVVSLLLNPDSKWNLNFVIWIHPSLFPFLLFFFTDYIHIFQNVFCGTLMSKNVNRYYTFDNMAWKKTNLFIYCGISQSLYIFESLGETTIRSILQAYFGITSHPIFFLLTSYEVYFKTILDN